MARSRKSKWRRRIVGVVVVLASAFYAYFLHRSHEVVRKGDWLMASSYSPFHCRVCLGRVDRLEYAAESVAVPDWDAEGKFGNMLVLITPAGTVRAFHGAKEWRLYHSPKITDMPSSISETDIERGYYDLTDATGGETQWWVRKKGTPAHWCLCQAGEKGRWVNPAKLGELDW